MVSPNSGPSAVPRFLWSMQLVAACVVAFVVVGLLTPHGAAVSPDSIFYLDIATHIHNGLGATSTDYALLHAGENRAVPNATWPPLYPLLLALGTAVPGVGSAATWSGILLAATLFFTQRILGRFLPWMLATAAALPLALVVPMLTIHTFAWSEQLFSAVLVALFYVAQCFLTGDARQGPWLIALVALLLVLAFYTRYIGLLFFPLLPLLYFLGGRSRAPLWIFVAACIACALAAVALLAYNQHVSGSMTGATRLAAQTTLSGQLHSLASALVPMFFSGDRPLLVGLSAMGAAAALLYLPYSGAASVQPQRVVTARLALGMASYYLLCILALRSAIAFDKIDVRLLGVAVPYLWIGCIALIAGFEPKPAKAAPALLATMVLVALAVNGWFTLFQARASWIANGSPGLLLDASSLYENYNLQPVFNQNRRFMAARTNPDSVLVADDPQVLGYSTGLTVYALPKDYSAEEMRKLAAMPARSFMVLYPEQRDTVVAQLVQHGAPSPEVTVIGDTVLVALPLSLQSPAN